ncbi:MAG: 6-bladed beta-propeller [Bacteroidetes bacterium]|nr:6-bladed beta-propeller [Bacteroidota bacterium]
MIAHYRNIYYSLFISLVIIFLYNTPGQAQDTSHIQTATSTEQSEIQWVSQWSFAENQNKALKYKIKDFIVGKKTLKQSRPVSVIATDPNSFWFLDQGNNEIFQVSDRLTIAHHFIDKKELPFSSLVGICNFHKNEILFTDSYLNKIFLVDTEKKELTDLNDTLKLNKPTGIAYSKISNEIWVLETGEHRIVILNDKGEIIKKIGMRGLEKGEFNFPTHIWIDKKGNAYVADAMNFRVQVFDKDGAVLSVFGSNGNSTGYFSSIKGIATDSNGNIYVADALFNAVQIFDLNGNFLYTFGSQGQGQGQFWMPSGIYIDDADKIYVADSYNSRIQVFQLIKEIKK